MSARNKDSPLVARLNRLIEHIEAAGGIPVETHDDRWNYLNPNVPIQNVDEASRMKPMNLPPLPPLQDGDIKALYIAEYGTEEGWLSRDGSYFIAGVQAARTYAEQYGRLCAEAEHDRLMDGVSVALQCDLENGVKWLNEIAANEFTKKYQELNAWLRKENK